MAFQQKKKKNNNCGVKEQLKIYYFFALQHQLDDLSILLEYIYVEKRPSIQSLNNLDSNKEFQQLNFLLILSPQIDYFTIIPILLCIKIPKTRLFQALTPNKQIIFINTIFVKLNIQFKETLQNSMQIAIRSNHLINCEIKTTSEHLQEPKQEQTKNSNSKKKISNPLSINGVNCIQNIFFTWPYQIVQLMKAEKTNIQDLPHLPSSMRVEKEFEASKNTFGKQNNKGLFKILYQLYGSDFKKLVALCFLVELFYLSYPILIYYNIDYLENHKSDTRYGIGLFLATLITSFFYNLTYTNLKYLFRCLGVNVSTHLNLLIFDKSLRYSLVSNKIFNEADLINYSQIDTENMMLVGSKLSYLLFGLIETVAGFILLYFYVGLAFIAGLIVLIAISALSFSISRYNLKLGDQVLTKKDERLQATQQLLGMMKFIKQNAFQKLYFKRIQQWREQQLRIYQKKGIIEAVVVFLYFLTTPAILTSIILTCIYIDGQMTPAKLFTAMMISVIFEVTAQQLPKAITELFSVINSINRIEKFLNSEQIKNENYLHNENQKPDDKYCIKVRQGEFNIKSKKSIQTEDMIGKSFQKKEKINFNQTSLQQIAIQLDLNHTKINELSQQNIKKQQESTDQQELLQSKTILKKINLNIEKGKLYMIFGDIGSGKSSLLLSILNEYNKEKKSFIEIWGKIAYVSQKPWIFSGTIQNNILFSNKKDVSRQQQIIEYACLKDDLTILPQGILTQIGQNGVNLSGGQKFRVDLARSLYSNSDIYLFDDIISAVDVHVSTSIMQKTIKKYLASKTILMATHAVKFAELADYIILIKEGEIVACQTYEQARKNPYFSEIEQKLIQQEKENKEGNMKKIEQQIIKQVIQESEISFQKEIPEIQIKLQQQIEPTVDMILPQQTQKGSVGFAIFKAYIDLNGGVLSFLIPITIFLVLYAVMQTLASIIMSQWSSAQTKDDKLLYTFIGLTLSASAFIFFQALILTVAGVKQGNNVHRNIIKGLLYADIIQFFNRVPLGRILNRLSKDLKELDEVITATFCSSITSFFKILSCIVITIYTSTPYAIIPIIVVAIIFIKVRSVYIDSQNELIRLQKLTNSPLVIAFTNGIRGATVIRSYKRQKIFIQSYIEYINNYRQVLFNRFGFTNWFVLILVYLTFIINIFSIGFCMFSSGIGAANIGLLLTYILNFNDELYQFVINETEFQTQLISLERVYNLMNLAPETKYKDYCKNWDQNEQKVIEQIDNGEIKFQNVSVRYRPGLPKVLKELNVHIKSGETVGVVGRTGSGKSTLINTLLQIIPITDGQIFIGGAPLSKMSLKTLRRQITVIDQQPVLMGGTIRQNLDPTKQYTDDQIMSIIKDCRLEQLIQAREGLDGIVSNGSFSAGQKQLICICRAILRKSKIVLIDEATANIDTSHDIQIQRVLKKAFSEKTVITIAHRLSSIAVCDKIMVMEKGRIHQFGSPQQLIKKQGLYYHMDKKYRKNQKK